MSKDGLIKVVEQAAKDKSFLEKLIKNPNEAAMEIGVQLDEKEVNFLKAAKDRIEDYAQAFLQGLQWCHFKGSR